MRLGAAVREKVRIALHRDMNIVAAAYASSSLSFLKPLCSNPINPLSYKSKLLQGFGYEPSYPTDLQPALSVPTTSRHDSAFPLGRITSHYIVHVPFLPSLSFLSISVRSLDPKSSLNTPNPTKAPSPPPSLHKSPNLLHPSLHILP